MEVVPVHSDEEFVHHSVGPETVHLQSHQVRAVGQFSIGLNCVLPAAPLALIENLHVQLELGQAELLNDISIVTAACCRQHRQIHN